MRVTLNQEELFDAISAHLIDKLNLDNSASIEISLTAGRSPKGYTADVEITYPRSPLSEKCKAKEHTEEDVHAQQDLSDASDNTSQAVPTDNLFAG